MTFRRLAAPLAPALIAVALTTLPACSSSGGTSPGSSSAGSGATGVRTPAALAAELRKGIPGITGATVTLDASLLGTKINGTGPAAFRQGELSAVDLSGTIAGVGNLRVRAVGTAVYAQVPKSLNTSGKPWLRASARSSNTVAAQLGKALTGIRAAASLNNLATLVQAAPALTVKGRETVGGASATHYGFVVDATRLPASFPERSDLAGSLKGTGTDLWVDAQGRPVKVSREVVVNGQPVPITIGLTRFGSPATIKAPPASQVATS